MALLLVEGGDDKHLFRHMLFSVTGLPEKFVIKDAEGYEQLRKLIPVYIKGSDTDVLGIVVDADADLGARWQSLRDVFATIGVAVPGAPDPGGTVVESDTHPRVGIWVMPDNRLPGMMEDFAKALVPEGNWLIKYAKEVVDGIPGDERRFSDVHRSKVDLATWLAWQECPGRPVGLAVFLRYLDCGRPEGVAFIHWIRRLFDC